MAGVAGVLGYALVAKTAEARALSPDTPTLVPEQALPTPNMTLYAPFLLTRTFRQFAVEDQTPATQLLRFGELHDKLTDGTLLGEFRSVGTGMQSPFLPTQFNADVVEYQVFTLADGIIYGIGAFRSVEQANAATSYSGWFAVSGGTDKYTGLQGRYQMSFYPADFGGDNTARIDFYTYNQRTVFVPTGEKN
ncbi:MAG: hypothetical protein U0556_13500 [Dehalococcoidia bacterium]